MKESEMSQELDQLAPAIAKWLAPFIAAELGLAAPGADPALSPDYDEHTCEVFAAGLGDAVLPRAEWFFLYLATAAFAAEDEDERYGLESTDLAESLNLASPRQIASTLTNSLKKRAKKLGLPYPWIQSQDGSSGTVRTTWIARRGEEAGALHSAIRTERERRGIPDLYFARPKPKAR
jgi:hypothetical protein